MLLTVALMMTHARRWTGAVTKKILKRSEQRNRRDPEVNRVKKRARYRPSSSYFNLYLQTISDDDPCETLDGRGTKKTLRRSEQEMTTQTLDRSETQKEHGGTKKALDRSGLVSTNATLIMLKQEKSGSDLNTASHVLDNKKS